MNNIIYYFIFGCFLSRLIIAFIVKNINTKYYNYLSIIAFVIGLSFLKNFIFSKKNDSGFFKNKVWWNNYRLIHSFNYLIASYLLYIKQKYSWIILLIDAFLGLLFFFIKYYKFERLK